MASGTSAASAACRSSTSVKVTSATELRRGGIAANQTQSFREHVSHECRDAEADAERDNHHADRRQRLTDVFDRAGRDHFETDARERQHRADLRRREDAPDWRVERTRALDGNRRGLEDT